MPDLFSIPIIVNQYACEGPKFLRWRKSHRRSRINKKWHKKYGAIYKPCPGVWYEVQIPSITDLLDPLVMFGDSKPVKTTPKIVCCPHAKEALLADSMKRPESTFGETLSRM